MKPTGTLKLLDNRTRVVAVYGPLPPNGRRPRLMIDVYGRTPQEVPAFCFQAKDRTARFLVDKGTAGDQLLALLGRYPTTPARPVESYGLNGWLVRGLMT